MALRIREKNHSRAFELAHELYKVYRALIKEGYGVYEITSKLDSLPLPRRRK